jgi:hypothetical protein
MHSSNSKQQPVSRLFIYMLCLGLLALFGCHEKKLHPSRTVTINCDSDSINVVGLPDGVDQKYPYICKGDVVTWVPNGHTFAVVFTKDSPFDSGEKQFDNSNPHPKRGVSYQAHIKVFPYTITVDGQLAPDPQIVTGGGN